MSPKTKVKPTCMVCNSHDSLFITLANGEKLPSYTIKMGQGIICNSCKVK